MKHISQRQKGMTALGILIILGMVATFFVFGLALFPLYNEYVSVRTSMKSVLNQPAERRKTTKQIRKLFSKAADLNSVYFFTDTVVKEAVNVKKSKDGKTKYLNVKYQNSKKLFKNIYVMIDVDETMEIPKEKK